MINKDVMERIEYLINFHKDELEDEDIEFLEKMKENPEGKKHTELIYNYACCPGFFDLSEDVQEIIRKEVYRLEDSADYFVSEKDKDFWNNTFKSGFIKDGYMFINDYSGIAGNYWQEDNGPLCLGNGDMIIREAYYVDNEGNDIYVDPYEIELEYKKVISIDLEGFAFLYRHNDDFLPDAEFDTEGILAKMKESGVSIPENDNELADFEQELNDALMNAKHWNEEMGIYKFYNQTIRHWDYRFTRSYNLGFKFRDVIFGGMIDILEEEMYNNQAVDDLYNCYDRSSRLFFKASDGVERTCEEQYQDELDSILGIDDMQEEEDEMEV